MHCQNLNPSNDVLPPTTPHRMSCSSSDFQTNLIVNLLVPEAVTTISSFGQDYWEMDDNEKAALLRNSPVNGESTAGTPTSLDHLLPTYVTPLPRAATLQKVLVTTVCA
jgi:hypothetical protein